MSIGIYKIISPSGKIYIGQSINIEERRKHYLNLNKCKHQPKIYNSLRKHSIENHIFEIIEECSLEQLNERETYWKQYYLNLVNGDWSKMLFCGLYDTGGGPKSDEHNKKISNSLKGIKRSDETKKLISKKAKGRKHSCKTKNIMSQAKKGKKYSDVHKNKMSQAKKGNLYRVGSKMLDNAKQKIGLANSGPKPEGFGLKIMNNKERNNKIALSKNKAVLQYDLQGSFIKEWNSAKEAELFFGKEKADNIAGCCRGISKTAYEHKWIYKQNN
jgi:group I intron endonuclease